MVASTDIKFYVHSNSSAPQLTNNYGCMIDVLDACLVNGFGSQAVSTLTASGTTVTATFGSAHNFMQYQVIKITGATQTEYNGEHRILTVLNANSITFQLAAAPSVSTATGTINVSLPSLSWLKPFGSTGKAAYKSGNENLINRPFLRLVDQLDPAYNINFAKYAKVGIVEQMSDIDTLQNVQSPYDPSSPNKNWVGTGSGVTAINGWAKWYYTYSSNSDGTAISDPNATDANSATNGVRDWYIIGNQDAFILAIKLGLTSNHAFSIYGFGKYQSFFDGDVFNDFLASHFFYRAANWGANNRASYAGLSNNRIADTICLSRRLNNSAENSYGGLTVNGLSVSGQNNVTKSASEIGQLIFSPVQIWSESVFRGVIPFLRWSYQGKPVGNKGIFIEAGEIYLALSTELGSRESGQVFIKIGDL